MKHIVQFSGGVGSWAAAKRVAQRYGTDNIVLLFADVLDEHADLYRFLDQAAENIGLPITRISDGRTPRQVMRDERLIGNSFKDPCSKILKRHLLDRWRNEHCDQAHTISHIGIDWTESHRFESFRDRVAPWVADAPLLWEPAMSKVDAMQWLAREGIELPLLYRLGFAHNNCGGACIKAGQGQWAQLLRFDPNLYGEWEQWEQEMREMVGDHSILRDRSKAAVSEVLTLKEFRARVQGGHKYDQLELGGCGCAL